MKVIATIQSHIDNGSCLRLARSAFASHDLLQPLCSHSGDLDLHTLAKRLGGDFNMVERRQELLNMLRCSRCKRKGNMSIRFLPPTSPQQRLPTGFEAGAK